jgi:hypothetical protein
VAGRRLPPPLRLPDEAKDPGRPLIAQSTHRAEQHVTAEKPDYRNQKSDPAAFLVSRRSHCDGVFYVIYGGSQCGISLTYLEENTPINPATLDKITQLCCIA